ncbi:putative structural protein ODV-E66 [Mamestra configurata nucleopolyhedrovirus B]|uniref:Putative structural protein ODV-E66 n=1 Tax=Mamestra configurata nucleopolyhedrovirus B TaxID=204440 RepID=Q8JM11_9ABAC|nr:putative structural protein ODV-E66 [Mamestra configurata nucleopolyhedrovirus B]AAM95129.1 putative structural protein ODV-E66 [Mamestra configurata nucleopolyhedrovirus B]
MLVHALVIIAVLIIVALFIRPINNQNNYIGIETNEDEDDYDYRIDELKTFERYYINSLPVKFKQRNSRINDHELGSFIDDYDAIIEGLRPFVSAEDFSVLLHTLIAYSALLVENRNAALAQRLVTALEIIGSKLPSTQPTQRLPWNFDEKYWYVFSVTLTECAMQLCIVLRSYCDIDDIVVRIIDQYLVEANFSMGWRRETNYTIRMCVPYVYAQMLKGSSPSSLMRRRSVASVLAEVAYELRESGTGIRGDYVNFVDINVRNYSFLVDNYFVLDYYNALFGAGLVRFDNIHASINLIGNHMGIVHPAIGYKNSSTIMPALTTIMAYAPGIYCADFSKIVTVRNENYCATLVCPVNGVAYYQANFDYRQHALVWTMTKRIWPNNSINFINSNDSGVESGVLLLVSDQGGERVPADDVLLSPNTSMSFLPNPGFTAIAATDDCAAITSYSKFDALNVEYYSYTVFYRTGMFQLYDRIKTLQAIDRNAACVVLVRDSRDTNSNILMYDGMIAKHHNVLNYKKMVDFDTLNVGNNVSYVRQVINKNEINSGVGIACYSLCTQNDTSTTIVTKADNARHLFKVVVDEIECVFDFPFVVVKNSKVRQVTINNAYSVTKEVHTIHFDEIRRLLEHISLSVDNLRSDKISRTEFAFMFKSGQSNQFNFVY